MARASFLVLVALLPAALCCKYLDIDVLKADTKCADGADSVFTMSPDFKMHWSEDCKMTFTGCVGLKSAIHSAKISYKISGDVPAIEGKYDACTGEGTKLHGLPQLLWEKLVKVVLSWLHIKTDPAGKPSNKCLIPKGYICSNGSAIYIKKDLAHGTNTAGAESLSVFKVLLDFFIPLIPDWLLSEGTWLWQNFGGLVMPVGKNKHYHFLPTAFPFTLADLNTPKTVMGEFVADHGKDGKSCLNLGVKFTPK